MSEELKPCPFCGSQPVYVFEHADFIECPKCLATGPNASLVGGENRVIEAWNTRVNTNER